MTNGDGNTSSASASRRSSRRVALAALRRCYHALARETPLAPGDRVQILDVFAAAVRTLEATAAPAPRATTRALLRRIALLERQLAKMPAGERAAAIRCRLGLSRSRYYELRKLLHGPEKKSGLDGDGMHALGQEPSK